MQKNTIRFSIDKIFLTLFYMLFSACSPIFAVKQVPDTTLPKAHETNDTVLQKDNLKTTLTIGNTKLSNYEVDKYIQSFKYFSQVVPNAEAFFEKFLNMSNHKDKSQYFYKDYLIQLFLLKEVYAKNNICWNTKIKEAEKVFINYCKKNNTQYNKILLAIKQKGIDKNTFLLPVLGSMTITEMTNSIITDTLIPDENTISKFATSKIAVSDMRIDYEEFSIDKSVKNASEQLSLLKTEIASCTSNVKYDNKAINYKREVVYHSKISNVWSHNIQALMFDLKPGQVSTIVDRGDKISFFRVKSYEILGLDEDIINYIKNALLLESIDKAFQKLFCYLTDNIQVIDKYKV